MFSNWSIVSVAFVPEFLTFHISYAEFPVILSIYGHSTHNNEQFVVVKMKSSRY